MVYFFYSYNVWCRAIGMDAPVLWICIVSALIVWKLLSVHFASL
jgi:hypothetical protein